MSYVKVLSLIEKFCTFVSRSPLPSPIGRDLEAKPDTEPDRTIRFEKNSPSIVHNDRR